MRKMLGPGIQFFVFWMVKNVLLYMVFFPLHISDN
jgi:hypothetical protein